MSEGSPEHFEGSQVDVARLNETIDELEAGNQFILFPREDESGLETDKPAFEGDNDNELVIQYLVSDLHIRKSTPEVQRLIAEKKEVLGELLETLRSVPADEKPVLAGRDEHSRKFLPA